MKYVDHLPGCNVSLRRYHKDHEAMEAHLDEHLVGKSLPQAIAQEIPDSHTPFPPDLRREKPSFELMALSFPPAIFSPNSLAVTP